MWDSFTRGVAYYADFYYDYAIESWHAMTPTGYASVLIIIALIGYALMKSAVKAY